MEGNGGHSVEQHNQESGDLQGRLRKIAHDFSTPLGVIRMAAHFLKSGQIDAEKRERYVQMINLNLDKMEDILKQLRNVTDPGREASPGPHE
jgi:signal transduction histidine kinase